VMASSFLQLAQPEPRTLTVSMFPPQNIQKIASFQAKKPASGL